MDLTHCEYCGWEKGKYREALRLRVCAKCLRWLQNRRGGALDMSDIEDDYEELRQEGQQENAVRAAEERRGDEILGDAGREDIAPAVTVPEAAG